jgi:tetratricopeptide (TPR) repeat protein
LRPAASRGTGAGTHSVAGPSRLLSQRSLRRLVSRLHPCLSSLPPRQRRVLVLRTGFGTQRGYSRRQVARILRVSLQREGTLERQAVKALDEASAQDHCGNPVAPIQNAVLRAVSVVLSLTHATPPTAHSSTQLRPGAHQPSTTPPRERPGGPPQVTSRPPASPAAITPPEHSALNWELLALAFLGSLAALLVIVNRLRSRTQTATLEVPHARRLPKGSQAVAGAVGLAALRGAVSARRGHARLPGGTPVADEHPAAQPFEPPAAAEVEDAVAAFELGAALARKGDMAGAEAAYRRADEQGHPAAASNLGVLLEERGDLAGAEAAYQRADRRGDAAGAFNLGAMLVDRNDLAAAEPAFRRADERGDAGAAFKLGGLLAQRNDLAGAEAAYRRADARGHAAAASNLGVLLEQRGDRASAEEAYRRADERGDANGAFNLGGILVERNDLAAGEAAFRRADQRGDASGALNLGILLEHRGDLAGAEAAFHRADQRGEAEGSLKLGAMLEAWNDPARAEAAYRRASERGRADTAKAARAALGQLRSRRR